MDTGTLVPPFVTVVDFVGLIVFVLLPVYIITEIGMRLATEHAVEVEQEQ